MIVKNNYNECLTNFACSIKKYFGLEFSHNTLNYIDEILEKYNPQNVITILCDGMGSNIMDALLDKDSFLIKNRIKKITTVFPATTVSATTAIMTGLNPVETGMLGWDMYYKGIDKVITTFLNSEKGDMEHTPLQEAIDYKEKHMITKSIMDEINEKGEDSAYYVSPFGDIKYENIDEMFSIIKSLCDKDGRKYIYAYDADPDKTMHQIGCRKPEITEIIKDISDRVEKLSRSIKDAVIFVVADHGHIDIENIPLENYPDIVDCLERNTSIEPRAVNFFIKDEKKKIFVELFNKYFSNYFDLYDREDVICSKLFGDGKENEIYREILGDYLAIAKADKTIIFGGNKPLVSQHAGYTDDEIMVPIIAIETEK